MRPANAAVGLAVVSALIHVWQFVCAWRFSFKRLPVGQGGFPSVTVLKPLKGVDAHSEACLTSWLAQDYPGRSQFLFGVHEEADPAACLVRRLMGRFPGMDIRLVVCSQRLGPNAKVSTLAQLEPHVDCDLVVVSDADVFVPSDLVRQLAAQLEDPSVRLANCFYRLSTPVTTAMQWEAIGVNADFWSQVLQSCSMGPQAFALGAVMAARRDVIRGLGGFRSLVDHLADDYELGRRVAGGGGRIVMSPVVVECREPEQGWLAVWRHQLRWARTIRVCQPWPYFASVLNNVTLWTLLALVLAGDLAAAVLAVVILFLRMVEVTLLRTRLGDPDSCWRFAWLGPVKDLLSAVVWFMAFIGSGVEWRGRRFRVAKDGRLEEVPTAVR